VRVPELPRLQNRLTDRTLRALKPNSVRPYDLADGGDLYVRVEISGTVIFWLRYQLNGKRRRWVIKALRFWEGRDKFNRGS